MDISKGGEEGGKDGRSERQDTANKSHRATRRHPARVALWGRGGNLDGKEARRQGVNAESVPCANEIMKNTGGEKNERRLLRY